MSLPKCFTLEPHLAGEKCQKSNDENTRTLVPFFSLSSLVHACSLIVNHSIICIFSFLLLKTSDLETEKGGVDCEDLILKSFKARSGGFRRER